MNKYIVYHGSCHDGITALWAALQSDDWKDAEPYEGVHSVPPDLDKFRGADVLIVDFSWKRPEMTQLFLAANSVRLIDHHATAFVELADSDEAKAWLNDLSRYGIDPQLQFDMDRSGAGLTWDILHRGKDRPPLIDYVEDRDLWRFNLEHSREVHAACNSYPTTLERREILMQRDISSLIAEGRPVLRYHDKLAQSFAARARPHTFVQPDGHKYNTVTVECAALELISDVCQHMLANDRQIPFSSAYWVKPDGKRVFSLRSEDHRIDVGKVAASFGGGGHRNASGFTE